MIWLMQSRLLMRAACICGIALAAVSATAQPPDSATINGTITTSQDGETHTWTLTIQGLSFSHVYELLNHISPDNYSDRSITRVYATSFDFQFQGPRAEELNANVSYPLVNSGIQDGPVVELINFTYFDEDWDWLVQARDWRIEVMPSDYQQGLCFSSTSHWGWEWPVFSADANGYPALAPFTSSDAQVYIFDQRPGSGYSMGTWQGATVSVSSVGFALPGDYNHNGAVDAADYVAWRKSPNYFGGDPGGYNIWRTQFGQQSSGGAGTGAASSIGVPEPGGVGLIVVAVPELLRRRRANTNHATCLAFALQRSVRRELLDPRVMLKKS